MLAGLLGLGTWQMQRRAWKLDLIERVEARLRAAPVEAPGPAEWPRITEAADAYRRVRLTGTFLDDRETLVQAVTAEGAGFWVMTPLRTAQGSIVLVNRGFVPPDLRAPESRPGGRIANETVVTGLLRLPEPGGAFLRSNDPVAGRWYSRDVAAIGRSRGLAPVAPYFIDADARPDGSGWPLGGLTVVGFNNTHLVYALTWYALAVMLAGGLGYTLRQERATGKGES